MGRSGKAVAGNLDGGGRDLLKFHRAEAFERSVDSRDFARYCNRKCAIACEPFIGVAVSNEHVDGRMQRRALAIIQSKNLSGLRDVNQHEAAATDSARGWIRHARDKSRRRGGIDRIAAMLKNPESRCGGEFALRHHNRMRCWNGCRAICEQPGNCGCGHEAYRCGDSRYRRQDFVPQSTQRAREFPGFTGLNRIDRRCQ
jgi:hypothetical protein